MSLVSLPSGGLNIETLKSLFEPLGVKVNVPPFASLSTVERLLPVIVSSIFPTLLELKKYNPELTFCSNFAVLSLSRGVLPEVGLMYALDSAGRILLYPSRERTYDEMVYLGTEPVLAWLSTVVEPRTCPSMELPLELTCLEEILRPLVLPSHVLWHLRHLAEELKEHSLYPLMETLRYAINFIRSSAGETNLPIGYTTIERENVRLTVPSMLEYQNVERLLKFLNEYFTVPVRATAISGYICSNYGYPHLLVIEPDIEEPHLALVLEELEGSLGCRELPWYIRGLLGGWCGNVHKFLFLGTSKRELIEKIINILQEAENLEKAIEEVQSLLKSLSQNQILRTAPDFFPISANLRLSQLEEKFKSEAYRAAKALPKL